MFRLGCTPAINLFAKPADPITLTHAEPEYRVVPDRRRPEAHEVYSIDEVKATSPRDDKVVYQPLYSFKHGFERERQTAYWHAVRRPAAGNAPTGRPTANTIEGTEVFLSLVDLRLTTSAPADWTLSVNTTCLNRDLPKRLHQPRFQLLAAGAPVAAITCRVGPTPTLRPELKQGAMWRLVSHLTLNQLSIAEGDESAAALREILSLYDVPDSEVTRPLIEGLRSVRGERSVRRVGGGEGGLCRGTKVRLHLDDGRFFSGLAYLFSAVLSQFFGLYCTLNSFTELVVTTEGRRQSGEGELAAWPPRAGERPLL
jgi:type VI secretion system protein ImpG